MSKDYSNINHLAMGNLSHEQLALKVLQQTRSTEELMSTLRAAHDRILHLVAINPAANTNKPAANSATRIMTDAERADFGKNTPEFQLQCQVRQLTAQLEAANIAATVAQNNHNQAEQVLAQLSAQVQEITSELDSCKLELTKAYVQVQSLQTQLDDIHENYEVVDEEEGEEENEQAESSGNWMPTRDQLRELALQNGFRVRPQPNGSEDLNDYVYKTLEDSIKLSRQLG